jgi:XTP/dITP diphosphohydrolase/ATP diphosphatase
LQVLFYAQMAADAGYFNIGDVADNLNAKLVRRHPHVFADTVADTSGEVLHNWEQIKQEEKRANPTNEVGESLLADIPRTMPATLEAYKLGSRAAKVGFDWPDSAGLFAKMDEELAEMMVEVEAKHSENVEAEFGDLMFTAMNLARHLKIDAESALRRSNAKFRRRFGAMERSVGGPEGLRSLSPDKLEALWAQAKELEDSEGEMG